ncbi:MAG: hypothetical protein KDD83_12585 [Caldilineaceae bacterium]|nr:hypothetical protein [Caldilineaceae bacterium]
MGLNLMHTGANNSLVEVTNTAHIYDDGGNDVLRVETNLTNCHTHFDGSGAATLEDYVFTGRFKMLAANVGVGFTVYSDYPNSDTYYRVRRYSTHPTFRVENHGSGYDMQGTSTVSSYNPADDLNVWHRFKIEVNAGGSGVEIRARFWLDGDTEPVTWDIDCYDANDVLSAGTFGLWYMAGGPNNILFDDLHVEGQAAYGGGTVDSQVTVLNPPGVANDDYLFCVITHPSTATITPPAGWTQRETRTTSVPAVRSTLYSYWWQTGDPTSHTFAMNATGAAFGSMIAIRYQRTASPVFNTSSIAGNDTSSFQPAALTALSNGMAAYFLVRHDDAVVNVASLPTGFVDAGLSIAPSGSYGHRYYFRKMTADDATYSPSFGNMSESGDYVWFGIAAHPEDATAVPFYLGAAWGYVSLADPQPGDVTSEEVAYDFTTLGDYQSEDGSSTLAVGLTAAIDARVQDYGDPDGDVYMILNVLDKKGAPYIKLARHHGYNQATGRLDSEVIGQFGQLAGLGLSEVDPQDEPGLVVVKEDGRKVLLTPDQFVLEGAAGYWYDSNGLIFLRINDDEGIMLRANPDTFVPGWTWPNLPSTQSGFSIFDWRSSTNYAEMGGVYGEASGDDTRVLLLSNSPDGKHSELYIKSMTTGAPDHASIFMRAEESGSQFADISLYSDYNALGYSAAHVTADGVILTADNDILLTAGHVGVNEASPAYPLDVGGRVRAQSGFFSLGTGTISSGAVWSHATDIQYGCVVMLAPQVGTGVPYGLVWLNDNNTAAGVIIGSTATLAVSTTAPSAGVDNYVTVAMVDGTLYVKNGLNYNANYAVTIFGR